MTDKKYIPILLCSAVIAVVLCVWIVRSTRQPVSRTETRLLQGGAGWGYDILVNGKMVIHQPVVPAHGGARGFSNKMQAAGAASLVTSRLGNNDFPRLTQQEVDSIVLLYPDNQPTTQAR